MSVSNEKYCSSSSGLNEECGVFAAVAKGPWPSDLQLSNILYLGLVALQHRGQESAGIVVGSGYALESFKFHRGHGLVCSVFSAEILPKLQGNIGIAHTRYSTAGGSHTECIQPLMSHTIHGRLAIAHNGELINKTKLRQKVLSRGVGLSSESDSELLLQLLSLGPKDESLDLPTATDSADGETESKLTFEDEGDYIDWPGRIRHVMQESPAAYSLAILHGRTLYAVRDPFGNRPLCLGELVQQVEGSEREEVTGWVVSSESCAFQSIGARFLREVRPGEIVEVTSEGVRSMCEVPRPRASPPAFCIFEYVYFSRADSFLEGQMVYSVRVRCGEQLAREAPACADLVSTVPESATPAALGFASQSGLPFVEVLCKNRYIGRTFIQPSGALRRVGVVKKFGVLTENFRGRRVVLIDDSIVRGTTIAPVIRLLKDSGAKEVHIRVASPPIRHPCYMGINIPTSQELIANRIPPEQLSKYLGADSVQYLSVSGLLTAVSSGIPSTNHPEEGGSRHTMVLAQTSDGSGVSNSDHSVAEPRSKANGPPMTDGHDGYLMKNGGRPMTDGHDGYLMKNGGRPVTDGHDGYLMKNGHSSVCASNYEPKRLSSDGKNSTDDSKPDTLVPPVKTKHILPSTNVDTLGCGQNSSGACDETTERSIGESRNIGNEFPRKSPALDLGYLPQTGHCAACLTGTYPVDLDW